MQRGKYIVLENKSFGKLKVLNLFERNKQRQYLWNCLCECGKKVVVRGINLRTGKTKSCGCLRKINMSNLFSTHKMSRDRIYLIWQRMNGRCRDFKNKRYGGRGIRVEWKGFRDFIKDMHSSYLEHCKQFGEKNTTIERINVNGNYSFLNCRWASWKEQAGNRNYRLKLSKALSKYKGVTFFGNRWHSQIYMNKRKYYIGSFQKERHAAMAYDIWAKELHKEKAVLNF